MGDLTLLLFKVFFGFPLKVIVELLNYFAYSIKFLSIPKSKNITYRLSTSKELENDISHAHYTNQPYKVSQVVRNNPEEAIRDYVCELLIYNLRYASREIQLEIPIYMGSSVKRIDIAIYSFNSKHNQEDIEIIIECKRYDYKDFTRAFEQLKSYMSACPNARYGVIASHNWLVYEKIVVDGKIQFLQIESLPNVYGAFQVIDYKP